MGTAASQTKSSPGFWIFLYSIATLGVFLAILMSQTDGGRQFLNATGWGGAQLLDGAFQGLTGAWQAFLDWLPPEYRPGSAGA